jgi:hypothetical protein
MWAWLSMAQCLCSRGICCAAAQLYSLSPGHLMSSSTSNQVLEPSA